MNADDQKHIQEREERRRIYQLGYIRGHADGWLAMKGAMSEAVNNADFRTALEDDFEDLRNGLMVDVDKEIRSKEDMEEAISAGIRQVETGWR